MVDLIVKNLHVLLILYAGYGAMEHHESKTQKLQVIKQNLEVADAKLRKRMRELKAVKKFQENLDESKRKVKEIIAKIEEMQRQLPSDIQDTEVSGKLADFATQLKMISPSLTPKNEVDNKFYYSKEYNFDSQGTYLQTLIFFEKLEMMAKSDRILNVKYVKMKNSEDADPRSRFKILDVTTTVEAYRYNNQYDPAKDIE